MIAKKSIKDVYPFSLFQEEVYALTGETDSQPNSQVSIRIEGVFDSLLMEQALRMVSKYQEATRSIFYRSKQDTLLQVVYQDQPVDCSFEDLSVLETREDKEAYVKKVRNENAHRRLNLKDDVLIKATALKLDHAESELILTYHPMVMDNRSAVIFINQFFEVYHSLRKGGSGELTVNDNYKSYLEHLGNADFGKAKQYWSEKLKDNFSSRMLPRKQCDADGCSTQVAGISINFVNTSLLMELSERCQAGIEDVIKIAWTLILGKYSGRKQVMFGALSSYRNDLNKDAVGLFSKVSPFEMEYETDWSFAELMSEYKKASLKEKEFCLVRTGDLKNESAVAGRFYDIQLIVNDFSFTRASAHPSFIIDNGGLLYSICDIQTAGLPKGELTCVANVTNEVSIQCHTKSGLYDKDFVQSLLEHLKNILIKLSISPDVSALKVRELLKLEEKETLRLLGLNDTQASFPSEKTVDQMFEEQALKTPDALAVVCGSEYLTYKELNARANRLAHHLRHTKGVRPDDVLGVMLNKSENFFVAILAILKAGGAFLPIDPNYPVERNEYILSDAKISLLLTDSSLMFNVGNYQGELVVLDIELHTYPDNTSDLKREHNTRNLAYVIYTSGSTGYPKGVMIEHRSLVNLSCWHQATFSVGETSRATLYSEIGFDASVWEVWPYLISGASLYVIDAASRLEIASLLDFLQTSRITHCFLPTAIYEKLPPRSNLGEVILFTGGDKLRKVVDGDTTVVNNYGPTEATVVTTSIVLDRNSTESGIPIGKPISNMQVMILDENLYLQPIGVVGEICISGVGVARGYLYQEDLTKQKFVVNPYNTAAVMYRTGDYGRLLKDGNIEFVGRKDSQLKLRGYRIEAAEIEKRLMEMAGIEGAVVMLKEGRNKDPKLVAYLLAFKDVDERDIRDYLGHYLPPYMIPSKFVLMRFFPLTSRGKIQYSEFPDPDETDNNTSVIHVAPGGPIETRLADIWKEILGLDMVSATHDFFDVGGHSLNAVQLISAIHKAFDVKLKLTDIFSNATIKGLANILENSSKRVTEALTPIEDREYYDVSHAQKRLWLASQMEGQERSYNLLHSYLAEGAFNLTACEKAFRTLIQRHESLRTTFLEIDGEIKQKINKVSYEEFKLQFADLRGEPRLQERLNDYIAEQSRIIFDLKKGPLLKVQVLQTADARHILLFNMHHIVTDGWSMEVLANEFGSLYESYTRNGEVLLPSLKVQYKDFAFWQNQQLKTDGFLKLRDYWLDVFHIQPEVLDLPIDFPRPKVKSFNGSNILFALDPAETRSLRKVTNENGATVYMTVLSMLNLLLNKFTRQKDIVIGTPVAGRELDGLQDQVGMYMNILALRNRIDDTLTFNELLHAVKENTLKAFEHQQYPFDLLLEGLALKRDYSRSPLFDVGFTWQNTSGAVRGTGLAAAEGIRITPQDLNVGQVKTDLWLMGWEVGDQLQFSLSYNTDLYKRSTITKMIDDFKNIAGLFAREPERPICDVMNELVNNQSPNTMLTNNSKGKNLEKFFNTKKKTLQSNDAEVRESYFDANTQAPLIIEPGMEGVILKDWIANNKDHIERTLLTHGGILFRGFDLATPQSFQEANDSLSTNQMNYTNRSSPRSQIAAKLYTSTDHPADQVINMHNELSYSHTWPMQILFFCYQPAAVRGETPIADSRKVLSFLSRQTVDRFRDKGIKYVRNIVHGIGLSWQEVYQTGNKLDVEDYCAKNNVDFEWVSDEHLRISWTRPAIQKHPVTGEDVWFNHGYFYSPYNLDPTMYEVLTREGNLPFCTYYGDGTSIEQDVVRSIAEAYEKTKISFSWKKGDLLLLDNMLMAHGRNSYEGDRKILVAMNEPYTPEVVDPVLSYDTI